MEDYCPNQLPESEKEARRVTRDDYSEHRCTAQNTFSAVTIGDRPSKVNTAFNLLSSNKPRHVMTEFSSISSRKSRIGLAVFVVWYVHS